MRQKRFSAEQIVAVLWLNYRELSVPIGKRDCGMVEEVIEMLTITRNSVE